MNWPWAYVFVFMGLTIGWLIGWVMRDERYANKTRHARAAVSVLFPKIPADWA